MSINEQSTFAGRNLTLTWCEAQKIPSKVNVSQVSAFCLNENKEVLIIKNKHGWGLPGGHPEPKETIEESLRREIKEEASCLIKDFQLFGYVEVVDPHNNSIEGRNYIQLRFLCNLDKIDDFKAEFETSERQFVLPKQLPEYVTWMESSITGKAQYESFMKLLK